jgi:hypothetical protein
MGEHAAVAAVAPNRQHDIEGDLAQRVNVDSSSRL